MAKYFSWLVIVVFAFANIVFLTTSLNDVEDKILLKMEGDPIPGRRVLWSNEDLLSEQEIFEEKQLPKAAIEATLPCHTTTFPSNNVEVNYSSTIVDNGKKNCITGFPLHT